MKVSIKPDLILGVIVIRTISISEQVSTKLHANVIALLFSEEANKTYWSEWSQWSSCSEFCIKKRQRSCIAAYGYSCNEITTDDVEEQHCTTEECSGNLPVFIFTAYIIQSLDAKL